MAGAVQAGGRWPRGASSDQPERGASLACSHPVPTRGRTEQAQVVSGSAATGSFPYRRAGDAALWSPPGGPSHRPDRPGGRFTPGAAPFQGAGSLTGGQVLELIGGFLFMAAVLAMALWGEWLAARLFSALP